MYPTYCVLTDTQCPASWGCHKTDTNAFSCPVPALSPSCAANLNITCSLPSAPPLAPTPEAPLHSSPPGTPPLTPAGQVQALKALYAATNGTGWTTKINWMRGDPCTAGSTWYGVYCSGDNVTTLDFCIGQCMGNGLKGTLPTQVGRLTAITGTL